MNKIDKPIDVIFTTDSAGIIKPQYFYVDTEKGFETYVVERLIRRDNERINGERYIAFTCEIVIDNMKRLCDLKYNEDAKQWILYRM
jgi:hypothetical protein